MNRSYIGLGGNQGNVVATMDAALAALDDSEGVNVTAVSHVYETAPVGSQAGNVYLNAAAEMKTALSPASILDQLQQVERSLGRQHAQRWAGRPIDLDLLLVDGTTIDTPRLTVPHPHLWWRRFVLDPLAEIGAEVVHPVFDLSVQQLQADLRQQPLKMAIAGGCAEDRLVVGTLLRRQGIEIIAPESLEAGSLRLQFVSEKTESSRAVREIDLTTLPGSIPEAAISVLTAVLDEPRVHSRPLRRIP